MDLLFFGVVAVLVLSLPGIAVALLLRTPKNIRRAAFLYALVNGISVSALAVLLILTAAAKDESGLSLSWLIASALLPFALCFALTFVLLSVVFRRRSGVRR